MEHCQLVNFIYHMYNRYDGNIGPHDRCLALTNIMFDVSVWEFFLTLLFGARLVILPGHPLADVFALPEVIKRYEITLLYLPPGFLKEVAEQLKKEYGRVSLHKLLVGVEPIRAEVLQDYMRLNPGMRIINGYGPTETTICATSYNYLSCEPRDEIVPIGGPLSNNQVILLDSTGRLVPQGIPGEICVSGVGVSRGYLNNPALTAEKYTVHPYFKGKRMYRTGDLARLLPDPAARGTYIIQFLGRLDHQVKIRGFRIELGEIENRLSKHENIKEAVVVDKIDNNGDKYLCAYIVSVSGSFEPLELEQFLSLTLPDYMIPAYFIEMSKIPFTPNGKVDRKVLPEPGLIPGKEYTAPVSEIEKKLVTLWHEILAINTQNTRIGIDDNFFRLGGHSLKATVLASRIHKVFNVKIPVVEIFRLSTVRTLAERIHGAVRDGFVSIEAAEEREYYALSPAQKRLYILQQMEEARTSYNMFHAVVLNGDISKERFEEVFRKLLERHEILRTSFEMVGNEPIQRIHADVEFEMVILGDRDQGLNSFIRPFDLSRAPLLRAGLIKEADKRHILVLDMHHIAVDGTSVRIFIDEFVRLYSGTQLPPVKLQYKDFSEWQRKRFDSGGIKSQEEYWLRQFKDNIPRLNLPFDYERPAVQDFEFDRVIFEMDCDLTGKIKNFVSETGVTTYIVLLTAYIILLTKYSDQEDIVMGTGVVGRTHPDTEQIIGMFVNMLAIRSRPAGEKTVAHFLEEVKDGVLAAFENQDYPFDELVKRLHLQREYGRNPLFDTEFTFQENETPVIELPGLTAASYEYENSLLKFDLSLIAFEADDKIHLILAFSPRLFKRATIEMMAAHLVELLAQLPVNKNVELKELRITHRLSAAEIAFDRNDYAGFEF